ncbi:hypothetical protein [Paraburkholderia tropica]|nr:hypothetical protein [Paraburkholderia tropica]
MRATQKPAIFAENVGKMRAASPHRRIAAWKVSPIRNRIRPPN